MNFDQPRTVAYCDGPATEGVPEETKFTTRWAAWVSRTGVRIGKFSNIVPPSDSLGSPCELYPVNKPTALSFAFHTDDALVTMAIEKTETLIQLRKTIIGAENVHDIEQYEWTGQSPQLFNNWLLHFDLIEPNSYDMVCFYLKDSYPDKIYVRFEVDLYAIEYELNYELPSDLAYLIGVDRYLGLQQIMWAKTKNGDNATLNSDIYGPRAGDSMDESVELASGEYFLRAVVFPSPEPPDVVAVSISLVSGEVIEVAKAKLPDFTDPDKVTIGISLDQGQYKSEV